MHHIASAWHHFACWVDQVSYMRHTTAASPQLGQKRLGVLHTKPQERQRGHLTPWWHLYKQTEPPPPPPPPLTASPGAQPGPTSLVQSSKRTWYPTTPPSEQPISSATRCATDTVATRRGWVTPMAPCSARPGEGQRTGTLSCAAQGRLVQQHL